MYTHDSDFEMLLMNLESLMCLCQYIAKTITLSRVKIIMDLAVIVFAWFWYQVETLMNPA